MVRLVELEHLPFSRPIDHRGIPLRAPRFGIKHVKEPRRIQESASQTKQTLFQVEYRQRARARRAMRSGHRPSYEALERPALHQSPDHAVQRLPTVLRELHHDLSK